ncbi:M48 family metalloprotease [Candidatus Poribacteria bacterium]|nr:M48 family metalloprotease [Candidatus Poribacteria bacterium]
MVYFSVPLIVALVALFSVEGSGVPPDHAGMRLLGFLITMWGPAAAVILFAVLLRRRIEGDEDLRERWLRRMRRLVMAVEMSLVAVFVTHVIRGGLADLADGALSFVGMLGVRRVLALVPLVVGMLACRLATHEIQRRDAGHRVRFLLLQSKVAIIPLAPVLIYVALTDLFEFAPIELRLIAVSQPWLGDLMPLALVIVAYMFAPKLLRLLWRTRRLGDLSINARVEVIARRESIRYRQISVWYTRGVRIANAAVAGLIPNGREIFVTDWLLHQLDDDEVEGVLAHELGHIKHRHLWVYLLFSFTYFGAYILLFGALRTVLPSIVTEGVLGPILLVASFFYLYFVLLLGFVSRRLERQADLFAVRNIRDPEAFPRALTKLAALHSLPVRMRRIFEWTRTHPSIERRVEFSMRAIQGRPEEMRYANTLHTSRALVAAVPAIAILLYALRGAVLPTTTDIAEMRAMLLIREAERVDAHLEVAVAGSTAMRRLRLEETDLAARAGEHFQTVLAERPDDAEIHYLHGVTDVYQERPEPALASFARVLRVDSTHVGALYAIAEIHADRGEWDTALSYVDRAAASQQGHPQIEELRERIRAKTDGQETAGE